MKTEVFEKILAELQKGERGLRGICNKNDRLRVAFIREAKKRNIELSKLSKKKADYSAPPSFSLPDEYLEMDADGLLQAIEKKLLLNALNNAHDKFWAGIGAKMVQLSQRRYCVKEQSAGLNETTIMKMWEDWAGKQNADIQQVEEPDDIRQT